MRNVIQEDVERIADADPQLWAELRNANVFITGGTGFFGKCILETIAGLNANLGLGIRATVLSRDPERFRRELPRIANHPNLSLVPGDVCEFAVPHMKFTHVIHAATQASAKLNDEQPQLMFDTIAQGTRQTLAFAKRCGARRFLLTSSGAIYGEQPPEMTHIPETFEPGGETLAKLSAYARGKRQAEADCAAAATADFGVTVARCFAFVGPYLPLDVHFAIGNFIRDQLNGGPIRVSGDGTPLRSYMYTSDLMTWLFTILLRGQSGRAYNVGSETAVSIADLAREVAGAIEPHVDVHIAGKANRAGAANRYVPSTQRAQKELAVKCHVSLREAIRRTHAWHTSGGAA